MVSGGARPTRWTAGPAAWQGIDWESQRFRADSLPEVYRRACLTAGLGRLRIVDMVRIHTVAIVLFTAALLAIPTLCMAGAAAHACECGEFSKCGHEATCSSDPCASILARPRQVSADVATWIGAPTEGVVLVTDDCDATPQPARKPHSESPPDERLPFPRSDIPLRI